MTQPNHHRIQRQLFELAIGPLTSGPALQASLARGFWERMLPALAEVFDSAAGPERLLRFDRIEIDLGEISGADWEPELERRLISGMARKLGEQAGEGASASVSANPAAPEGVDSFRQFLFFLEHGRLPWWAPRPLAPWRDCLPWNSTAREWGLLRATLLAEPRARLRCTDVLGDEPLDAALRALSGLENSAQLLALLTPAALSGEIARDWRRRFWLMLIDWTLAPAGDRVDGATLVQSLLELRGAHLRPRPAATAATLATFAAQGDLRDVGERLPLPWSEWHIELRQRAHSAPATHGSVARAATTLMPPPLAAESSARRKADFPVDEDAIYLGAAGAILLHPFLETLFRERGLLGQREFRDATARQRGVHLLGYLAFGRPDVPEHDLPLPKLLCGHPLEEPLDPTVLDADDLAACDALLTAVLGHWTALRSSSAHWLRTQFLLREGKLECVDEGHRLTVERRAQDVLLARIPWGFGVIALPWMPCRLFVHWLD
jgi:hypothetical protein